MIPYTLPFNYNYFDEIGKIAQSPVIKGKDATKPPRHTARNYLTKSKLLLINC